MGSGIPVAEQVSTSSCPSNTSSGAGRVWIWTLAATPKWTEVTYGAAARGVLTARAGSRGGRAHPEGHSQGAAPE